MPRRSPSLLLAFMTMPSSSIERSYSSEGKVPLHELSDEISLICNRVLILNHGKIVAEGSPEQIREQVQKDDRFTIDVAGTVDAAALKELELVSEILSTQAQDGRTIIKISAQKGADTGALIFDWAVKNGCRLSALIPEQASLENIFRKLTNQTEV